MSAIAGIFSRDGAPIDQAMMRRLSRALEFMAPDGERGLSAPGIALLHRQLHTDDPAIHTAETLDADGCLLTWDGRLDNGAEIERQCEGVRATDSDARLALAVYRRFGPHGFDRLVGDFSFALWDAAARQLILCVDPLGRRLLYYVERPRALYWASTARALQQALAWGPEPNAAFIGDFVINHRSLHGPFGDMRLMPPGHVLVATPTHVSLTRYWAPDPRQAIVYRSDAEYEEHFRALFTNAVRARMRAKAPVFCEVSGGIDSSSVACVAFREAEVRRTVPRPRSVSYMFEQSSTSDESRFIGDVERFTGSAGLHIGEDENPLLQPLPEDFVPDFPAGQLLFHGRHNHVARLMATAGSRVLLTGFGGDELFFSEPPPALPLADLLAQGRVITLARECRRWSTHTRRSYARTFYRGALAPHFPRLQFRFTHRGSRIPAWVEPSFAQRFDLHARLRGMTDDAGFRLPMASQQYRYLRSKMRPQVLEMIGSDRYIETRHPYLDRRLLEFALAIPADQKQRPGQDRSIVRRGLHGIMPPSICARKDKRGPDEAVYRAVTREWWFVETLFRDPLCVAYGVADAGQLRDMLQRARHGQAIAGAVMLIKILALEMWLAATHGRRWALPRQSPPPARRRHEAEPLHAERR
jgi:asparagine synthase (glutamine-hydrolysing)